MPASWPPDLTLTADVASRFDSDGGDFVTNVGRVTRPGTIVTAEFVPNWNLTGANTNFRTYTLFNRGPAGAGSAAVATLAMTSGVNFAKFVPSSLTVTAASAAVLVGDILELVSTATGTGAPEVGGQIIVQQTLNG